VEGGILGFLERGIAPSLLASTDLRRRALLAKGISLMLVLLGSLVGVLVFFVAAPELRWLGLINTLVTCGLASLSILFLRRGHLVFAGNWIASLIAIGIAYSVLMGGGIRAPFGVLLPVIPVLAMVISGRRSGIFWAVLTSLFIIAVEVARLSGLKFYNLNPEGNVDALTTIGLIGGLALLAWVGSFSEDLKERAIEQIQEASAQRDIAVAEETKARSAANEAIAANAAKSVFLATMSHELRTPLNAIIGYSELVEEELGDRLGEHVESMRRIRTSGVHLVDLISDILDLARLEADRLMIRPERFSLGELIDDLAATFDPLAKKRGNQIVARCAPELGNIFHDRARLRQVLVNLLGNAIKFTENGMITLTARPTKHRDQTWVEITVTDTGIGIPADKIGSIFESFVQVDSSFGRSYEGSGLGLSIVRRLVAMMGGTVSANSTLGGGTSMCIRLLTEGDRVPDDGQT